MITQEGVVNLSVKDQLASPELVNDVHSRLNQTLVKARVVPGCLAQLVQIVRLAKLRAAKICIAGGRHSMGGQQFGSDMILVDMTSMNQVLHFDQFKGHVEVQAGMLWPELISFLRNSQPSDGKQWTIAQKQTGCDGLSIGGALSANIHGRGLTLPPFVNDIEQFTIVMHDGEVKTCNRQNNPELFRLAIGGYGLFGVIASVTLRLIPKTTLRRSVSVVRCDSVVRAMEENMAKGTTYGDFQFSIDDQSEDFLSTGILSLYEPVSQAMPESDQKLLTAADWRELLFLAHTDKSAAFKKYSQHYLSTDGQLYASDSFQMSTYFENYHEELDKRLTNNPRGTEVITELYVPPQALPAFLRDCAALLQKHKANVIYGTVRMIEPDLETFLPWAKERAACIIFNLHVEHSELGLAQAKPAFQALIQTAISYGGSYYLTYHRFATGQQLLTCYPQLIEFVEQKILFDPDRMFSSTWFDYICDCLLTQADPCLAGTGV